MFFTNLTFLLLISIVLLEILTVKCETDYCKISLENTMCRFKNDYPRKIEGDNTTIYDLTDEEKAFVVKIHNKIRSGVALGKYTDMCCPSAAEMYELVWDDELYKVIHRWVIQCFPENDRNRDVERFKVAQNIYVYHTTSNVSVKEVLQIAVNNWFEEFYHMNKEDFMMYGKYGLEHFTTQAWGKTKYVACAIQNYIDSKKRNTTLIGCNYGPAGNRGQKLYVTGSPCSKCEIGYYCSSKYNGLCTNTGEGDIRADESEGYLGRETSDSCSLNTRESILHICNLCITMLKHTRVLVLVHIIF